jgi:chromosome segregation ATPase
MPATSQQQQKLMGLVHALQKGTVKPGQASKKAQQMAKSMKKSDVTDFAATKHKGLPKKVKKENMGVASMYVVRKPHADMKEADLVMELNPLEGIQPLNIEMGDVHSVHATAEDAQQIAAEAYKKCMDEALQLEAKKGKVGDKIKKAIDQLEKKRKEHMDMAKEDPKQASKHKEHIAKIAQQIDDLMTKMEKIEKSKKEIKKVEDNKKKDKKDIKESVVSERREYDQEGMEKLGFNFYPGGRTEAWEYATQELGISPAEILGKIDDDTVYNAIHDSLSILGYYNDED